MRVVWLDELLVALMAVCSAALSVGLRENSKAEWWAVCLVLTKAENWVDVMVDL